MLNHYDPLLCIMSFNLLVRTLLSPVTVVKLFLRGLFEPATRFKVIIESSADARLIYLGLNSNTLKIKIIITPRSPKY